MSDFNPFRLFSVFDWITPTKALVEHVAHDPTPMGANSWTFFIDYGQARRKGYSRTDIIKLMKKNGIDTWGHLTGPFNNETQFTVSRKQAAEAERILEENGIPIKPMSQGVR